MKKINLLGIILGFFAGIGIGYAALRAKIKPAVQELISNFVDDITEDIYPCKLIATIRFNQETNATIVDMSKYKELGIIGLVIDKTESPSEEEENLDGEPKFYPTAVVYNLRGHWLWKVL